MSHELSASLIVTTYNWAEALKVTLQSVLRQSVMPYEVMVADDGSDPKTAQVVKDVLKPSGLRWCHVWHQDQGVRQSRIKNLTVKYSRAPYLIFVDQDVVLHPDFIVDHFSMAEKDVFLRGRRSLLPEYYTKRIMAGGSFSLPTYWTKGLGNRKNTFRFPTVGRLISRPKPFATSLRGCNLSMFKSDFLKVDGFDEVFDQSWGREDSDICYRLFHSGLRIKSLWFLALQYHLHHEVIEKWDKERLDRELQKNLKERRVKALKGFSQLSSEGEIIAASNGF